MSADPSAAMEERPGDAGWVRQEAMAYGLALGGSLIPMAVGIVLMNQGDKDVDPGEVGFAFNAGATLAYGGFFVGPSTGQFYAGSVGHGLAGTGIRFLGGALMIVGIVNRQFGLTPTLDLASPGAGRIGAMAWGHF